MSAAILAPSDNKRQTLVHRTQTHRKITSRYQALATDGDGTLLRHKHMARRTAQALERLRASGRKVILVTGETVDELASFPKLELIDLVVAENGALVYDPAHKTQQQLVPSPPAELVKELRRRAVEPTSVGQVIVSVQRAQRQKLRRLLQDLGLDWQVISNRQRVMALPAGVDKASGLAAALHQLQIPPAEVVGVGDAENDLVLLRACGLGVAVANAVPLLRRHADLVTTGGPGAAIVELIKRLLNGGLPASPRRVNRSASLSPQET